MVTLSHQSSLAKDLLEVELELLVRALLHVHVGEEVIDQGDEEGLVLVHKLGHVHVLEDPHDCGRLRVLGVLPLGPSQGPQDREDVSQSKIIMDL